MEKVIFESSGKLGVSNIILVKLCQQDSDQNKSHASWKYTRVVFSTTYINLMLQLLFHVRSFTSKATNK